MVLGVSAGIAAYKAVEVCRRLVDAGVHVAPVLTERATRFVGKTTFDALGSEPAQTSLWEEESPIPHTRLGERADLVVVAPATADLLARYAGGFADDLLTATLVATAAPVVVCPAMHTEMWEHPAVRHNLAVLRRRGVIVVPPEEGRLAGGDVGAGRLADRRSSWSGARPAGRRRAGRSSGRPTCRRAGGGLGRGDPRADRPGAIHHQPVVGQAGSRPGRGGQPTRGGGRAGDREPAAGAAGVGQSIGWTRRPRWSRPCWPRAAVADVVIMAAAVADFRPKAAADPRCTRPTGFPNWSSKPRPTSWPSSAGAAGPGRFWSDFAAETDLVTARAGPSWRPRASI